MKKKEEILLKNTLRTVSEIRFVRKRSGSIEAENKHYRGLKRKEKSVNKERVAFENRPSVACLKKKKIKACTRTTYAIVYRKDTCRFESSRVESIRVSNLLHINPSCLRTCRSPVFHYTESWKSSGFRGGIDVYVCVFFSSYGGVL